jgi:hypothetical protein
MKYSKLERNMRGVYTFRKKYAACKGQNGCECHDIKLCPKSQTCRRFPWHFLTFASHRPNPTKPSDGP